MHSSGSLPSGVELPRAVPAVQCAGDGGTVHAVGYANVTLAQYLTQLEQTGWTDAVSARRHVLHKPGSRYEIVATDLNGNLAARYDPVR